MNQFNFIAISVAVIAGFVASALFYGLFTKKGAELSLVPNPKAKHPHPKLLVLEVLRNYVLAFVLAYLLDRLRVTTLPDVLWVSFLLWLAFPLMLHAGSVMFEKFPTKLAMVHVSDWAIKLPLMAAIIVLWP